MKTLATLFLLFTILHRQHNTCEANDIPYYPVRLASGGEALFVASIGLKNYGYNPDIPVHICSGVLITRKHVLTSAHCIDKVNITDVRVRLGYEYDKYKVKRHVKAWTTYKLWSKDNNNIDIESSSEHDMSILKLTKKVGCEIRPVVIANHSNDFFDGKQVKTLVWGTIKRHREILALRVAKLDVISYNESMKELNDSPLLIEHHNVEKSYLCTRINVAAVLEDINSGSPLLSDENELIAINDPTYLQRNSIFIPTNLNFHLGLDDYRTFIKSVTETKAAKWWRWKRN